MRSIRRKGVGMVVFENPRMEQWAGNLNQGGSSRIKKVLNRVNSDTGVLLVSLLNVCFQIVTHQNIWRFLLMNDP